KNEIDNSLASNRQSHAATHSRLEPRQLCRNFIGTQRQLGRIVPSKFVRDDRSRDSGIRIRQLDVSPGNHSPSGILNVAHDAAGRELRYCDGRYREAEKKGPVYFGCKHAISLLVTTKKPTRKAYRKSQQGFTSWSKRHVGAGCVREC